MIKKTVTYKGFDNVERTEDFYFHLSKAEILKMEMSVQGGFTARLNRIIASNDIPAIANEFEDLLRKSYGIKCDDGKRFDKNPKHYEEFSQTEAYSIIWTELFTDEEKAAEFVKGIIPEGLDIDESKINHPALKK